MKHRNFLWITLLAVSFLAVSCKNNPTTSDDVTKNNMQEKVNDYAEVTLRANLDQLTENQKKMIPLLIDIAKIMDEIFWTQAYGDKEKLMNNIGDDYTRKFAQINYGPWDRLNNNEPFVEGVSEKPKGANFYPADMTAEEFENFEAEDKKSQYTLVSRAEDGSLKTIPYHVAYKEKIQQAAKLIRKAAELAEDPGFKKYLNLRAEALETDDYLASDMAWMDMKTNDIDFVVGPIENYEDQLFGYKTAHEAFILIKDQEWSDRLAKYATMLPDLQKGLPVDEKYKQEEPGTNSDLGAYDVVYYAGDCNAGSKTIAINLPNDERVQLEKGSRRLQLKNSMQAKFDKIMVPISKELIAPEQQGNVTFKSFFENTMFHEVAHGLGIKTTINTGESVRTALKEQYSALEEGKADILGLYMVTKLNEQEEIEGDLMDNYVTFLAGIFRSIRFGASSAHGKANLVRFNYFKEAGAFNRSEEGTYSVDMEKMQEAMNTLSSLILTIQGEGEYEKAKQIIEKHAVIGEQLEADLQRLEVENIPVDIVFNQGLEVLNLEQ